MSENESQRYLEPTQESGRAFVMRGIPGAVYSQDSPTRVADACLYSLNGLMYMDSAASAGRAMGADWKRTRGNRQGRYR